MYYIINTQKNLVGTVEQVDGCEGIGLWRWNITSPLSTIFDYGCANTQPATWVDKNGNEQMAIIKTNEWGTADVALDTGLSGTHAEYYVDISEVDIISEKDGYTTQLRYPKSEIDYVKYIIYGGLCLTALMRLKLLSKTDK